MCSFSPINSVTNHQTDEWCRPLQGAPPMWGTGKKMKGPMVPSEYFLRVMFPFHFIWCSLNLLLLSVRF